MGRVLYPFVKRKAGLLFGLFVMLIPVVCPVAAAEFSVMTYNVNQYAFRDRDDDGEPDDPKPQEEQDAVVQLIAVARPDVLALQEMGGPSVFLEFQNDLRKAGLNYPYAELLQRGKYEVNLAVLSRFPLVAVRYHTNDFYRIRGASVPVVRGFLDVEVQVTPAYRFRLINVHLKSKVYSPFGQMEMRRNEARLLSKTVRKILDENPAVNLLVAGDLNDDPGSAPLREIGGQLMDLKPRDFAGDAWTFSNHATGRKSRLDYLLVSPGMKAEGVESRTRVVRDPLTGDASDHRPVIGVFRAQD